MEDKGSDRTSNRTSVIFIGEAFLVPTFHYLSSSVSRWSALSEIAVSGFLWNILKVRTKIEWY